MITSGLIQRLLPCLALLAGSACNAAEPWFTDVAEQAGLDFTYDNGMQGNFYFPEIMGGGVGVMDYDRDGLLDIYLVQGGPIGPGIEPGDRPQGDRLLRNRSFRDAEGRWQWRFEDVTAAAGIDARGYGMGVAVGDVTGNGYPDIYVLNFGKNQLWRNNGDGSFTDITDEAGVGDPGWSVSASFADVDGDGRLDLYLANYVQFDFTNHKRCRSSGGGENDYCSPSAYQPAPDRLYRNLGDGRFEDVSAQSGIHAAAGHGLGVVAADLNGDGRVDFYVANDGSPNFLWINQGGLRFVDEAVLAGAAVNLDGAAEAGMGVDVADINRNGREDIIVTHMRNESNTLYINMGKGWFEDRTARSGLAASSMAFTGFGVGWIDVDSDGWLDLLIANGAVVREPGAGGQPFPYAQGDQLFLHTGKPGDAVAFVDASRRAGSALGKTAVGRGAAFGDFNNDGRVDVLIGNIGSRPKLLANSAGQEHHWLGLVPMHADHGGVLAGTRLRLTVDDGAPLMRRSRSDGSYASASDPRVVFGLGQTDALQTVEVQWPDGSRERFPELPPDRYHELRRGQGRAAGE